jgi:uncharacterized membrane protein
MREWLVIVSEQVVVAIDWMAMLLIVFGTVEAFIDGIRLLVSSKSSHERRDVWLRFARWLIAGLTFQLAADIIETSIRTNWASIGQLGAVAVIRTFLNYFLERDLAEVRERQREPVKRATGFQEPRAVERA